MTTDPTEVFLDKYKMLESLAEGEVNPEGHESTMIALQNSRRFVEFRNELDYCREVRNLLAHKPKVDGSFAVQVSPKMLEFLDQIIARLKNRPRCLEIAIRPPQLFSRTLDDNVLETIAEMRERDFTHVPILDGKRVVGVFDADSIFTCMAEHGATEINNRTVFAGIDEHIALKGREGECFAFLPRTAYVDELEDLYEEQFKKSKRLAVAFITESGDPEQALLGMVTAWDLLALED